MSVEACTPVEARIERIHRLERLAEKVADELARETAALDRVMRARRRMRADAVGVQAPTTDIRVWGRANGWPGVGDRGRLPRGLMAAYVAAHPDQAVDL